MSFYKGYKVTKEELNVLLQQEQINLLIKEMKDRSPLSPLEKDILERLIDKYEELKEQFLKL